MLRVEAMETGYGDSRVLFGVDLEVAPAEAVALLGRNGMGKTTTVRGIFGLLPLKNGRVSFAGRDITSAPPFSRARAGLGLAPEGRRIFPALTVEENLIVAAASRSGAPQWTLARVYALFPRLAERRRHFGDKLSGGEQQMLAIGRALTTNPKLLVLDEATEGLAPLIRAELWACLTTLKAEGLSILVIDKNVGALLRFADRCVVLERGRVAWRGTSSEFRANPEIADRHLHAGGAPA